MPCGRTQPDAHSGTRVRAMFTEIPRGKDEEASKDLCGFGAKKTVSDADAKQTGNEK